MKLPDTDDRWRCLVASWAAELRRCRLERGLTEEQVADLVNLGPRFSATDVALLERGRPELSKLWQLLVVTEALELGALVTLAPAEAAAELWRTELAGRYHLRR